MVRRERSHHASIVDRRSPGPCILGASMLPVVVGAQVRAALEDYLETTYRFADPVLHRAIFDFLT